MVKKIKGYFLKLQKILKKLTITRLYSVAVSAYKAFKQSDLSLSDVVTLLTAICLLLAVIMIISMLVPFLSL